MNTWYINYVPTLATSPVAIKQFDTCLTSLPWTIFCLGDVPCLDPRANDNASVPIKLATDTISVMMLTTVSSRRACSGGMSLLIMMERLPRQQAAMKLADAIVNFRRILQHKCLFPPVFYYHYPFPHNIEANKQKIKTTQPYFNIIWTCFDLRPFRNIPVVQ